MDGDKIFVLPTVAGRCPPMANYQLTSLLPSSTKPLVKTSQVNMERFFRNGVSK